MSYRINNPIDIVIAITYQCNARCKMCNIWQLPQQNNDLTLEVFKKLPRDLKYINLSGGEPFLRADIAEIIKVLKSQIPKAKIIISSNGFATDLILKRMSEIIKIDPQIGVAISLDALGKKHDEIRGIPNGYDQALQTLKGLKDLRLKHLKIAYTAMADNLDYLLPLYQLSRDLKIEFTTSLAQSSDHYFGGKHNQSRLEAEKLKTVFTALIKSELKSFKPKEWLRAYFNYGLVCFSLTGKQLLPSTAGQDHCFLDPQGWLYPSVVHEYKLGNLIENYWVEVWSSQSAEKFRQKNLAQQQPVWMICTARTAIRRYWYKVLTWILKNKFYGFRFKIK